MTLTYTLLHICYCIHFKAHSGVHSTFFFVVAMGCERNVRAFSAEVALCGFQFSPCFSLHQFMNKHCIWDLASMLEGISKPAEFLEIVVYWDFDLGPFKLFKALRTKWTKLKK